jgi:hypothetical protein
VTTPNSVRRYQLGDLVTLTATIIGSDGITPAAPSVFMFLVRDASQNVSTYQFGQPGASVGNPGAGAFFKDVTVNVAGSWYYRSIATGGAQSVEEWAFLVDENLTQQTFTL